MLFLGFALIDLLLKSVENPPIAKTKLLCRHPFDQKKRAFVVPSDIKPLYKVKLICVFKLKKYCTLINTYNYFLLPFIIYRYIYI